MDNIIKLTDSHSLKVFEKRLCVLVDGASKCVCDFTRPGMTEEEKALEIIDLAYFLYGVVCEEPCVQQYAEEILKTVTGLSCVPEYLQARYYPYHSGSNAIEGIDLGAIWDKKGYAYGTRLVGQQLRVLTGSGMYVLDAVPGADPGKMIICILADMGYFMNFDIQDPFLRIGKRPAEFDCADFVKTAQKRLEILT